MVEVLDRDHVIDVARATETHEIRELRRNGYSFSEIANRLGISKTKAWNYGRNVRMRNDRRYERQRNEGVGAFRKNEDVRTFRNEEDDKRKIGTCDDIPYYNTLKNNSEKRKADVGEKERLRRLRQRNTDDYERERSKRWRENEKIHEEGRKDQIGVGTEVTRCVESMVTRKNPGGHLAKAFHHGMNALGKKRELLERGGDVRLIGDNMRKLAGDENSLLGFGIIYVGKEGILGNFRKKFITQRNEKNGA